MASVIGPEAIFGASASISRVIFSKQKSTKHLKIFALEKWILFFEILQHR